MTPETVTVGTVVLGLAIIGARIAIGLNRRANDHAERIAWLEAKANGKRKSERREDE